MPGKTMTKTTKQAANGRGGNKDEKTKEAQTALKVRVDRLGLSKHHDFELPLNATIADVRKAAYKAFPELISEAERVKITTRGRALSDDVRVDTVSAVRGRINLGVVLKPKPRVLADEDDQEVSRPDPERTKIDSACSELSRCSSKVWTTLCKWSRAVAQILCACRCAGAYNKIACTRRCPVPLLCCGSATFAQSSLLECTCAPSPSLLGKHI